MFVPEKREEHLVSLNAFHSGHDEHSISMNESVTSSEIQGHPGSPRMSLLQTDKNLVILKSTGWHCPLLCFFGL